MDGPKLEVAESSEPLLEWLEPSLEDTAGRDPLGFNTITLDRIIPTLMPGVLQLSQRARYFSIYTWMLWLFAERKRPATTAAIDQFIRRREFELCVAMKLCPRCDASGAIGSNRVDPIVASGEDPIDREFSIKTSKGGFGLYYRSPLADIGVVAPVGTPIGEDGKLTPVEVLHSNDPRVAELGSRFHDAIKPTEYFRKYESTNDPIPRHVMEELSESVCLCRLSERIEERDAIRAILFKPASQTEAVLASRDARARGFALFLSLIARDPEVATSTNRFRQELITEFEERPMADDLRGKTVAAWSALAMKEFLQECGCSIWTDFCRHGLSTQGADGMTRDDLASMINRMAIEGGLALDGVPLHLSQDELALDAQSRLGESLAEVSWESIAAWTASTNSAASGMIALLVLTKRIPNPAEVHPLWGEIAMRRSEHQDGLLGISALVSERLQRSETVGDFLRWVVQRFVISPHEVIAYSKLPRSTFRFTWEEDGKLRFFSPGEGATNRFEPSDDRRDAMASLSNDLGLWTSGSEGSFPKLTADGEAFVKEVFA